jgi:hypothetical protein
MKPQILSEEFRRMQKLAGITNEIKLHQGDKSGRDVYSVSVYQGRNTYIFEDLTNYGATSLQSVVQKIYDDVVSGIMDTVDYYNPYTLHDRESAIEECVVLKEDDATYIVTTPDDESYIIGSVESPMYGQFWKLLLNNEQDEAYEFFTDTSGNPNQEEVTDQFKK